MLTLSLLQIEMLEEMWQPKNLSELSSCLTFYEHFLCCSCLLGDRPGMLCSFKISTAWSCAWCLNPQADNCFSTGDLSARLAPPSVSVGKTSSIHLPAAMQITAKPTSSVFLRSDTTSSCDQCSDRASSDIWNQ